MQLKMTDQKGILIGEFVGYALVGGIATGVDISTLYVVTEYLGIYYLISNSVAFVLGLLTNYLLCIKFVFATRKVENRMRELVVFTGIGILGLGLNTFLLWSFTSLFEFYYMFSKLLAVFFVLGFNFLLRKKFLF